MLKKLLLFIWSCLLLADKVNATHIYGGELLYTHLFGNTYKVSLTLYGDCDGGAFGTLVGSQPVISLYNDNNFVADSLLHLDPNSNVEVTPVCEDEKNNTTCVNPQTGTIPGVKKFVYTNTVTIPSASSNWRFVFGGDLTSGLAGRSQSITNIAGNSGGNSVMYLEARLNNTNGPNSSPAYSTIPTPFYCVNTQQEYNQGAIDPDNDSLDFQLAPALNGGLPVTYANPYSGANPLSALNFSFNYLNGQMSFTPDIVQHSLIVNQVTEYKNGVMVGSSMREMTFIVLANCANTPPQNTINTSSVTGGVSSGNNIITVCEGTQSISFNISGSDPDGDNVLVTSQNVPAGAVLNIFGNNTSGPLVSFNWNTANVPAGIYSFYLNYKDDACPLSNSSTEAYTIKIVKPNTIAYTQIAPTHCWYKEKFVLNLAHGEVPRTITISKNGNVIKTIKDVSGIVEDSLDAGEYTFTVTSPALTCPTVYNIAIVDSGTFPIKPFVPSLHLCITDPVVPLSATAVQGGIINWYNMEGNLLPATPTYTTHAPAEYHWQVSQQYKVCESEKVPVDVTVHGLPPVKILTKPSVVCLGDRILLEATGAEYYKWFPEDRVQQNADGKAYTRILEPITFTLAGASEYGCEDSASIRFDQIEPCCQFSYPTAFTPNNDGRNDKYKVLLYGNHKTFDLTIFNRWGQIVFRTNDPQNAWDGTFDSKACDAGVYFYLLRSECMTGQTEEHKGDITLIR